MWLVKVTIMIIKNWKKCQPFLCFHRECLMKNVFLLVIFYFSGIPCQKGSNINNSSDRIDIFINYSWAQTIPTADVLGVSSRDILAESKIYNKLKKYFLLRYRRSQMKGRQTTPSTVLQYQLLHPLVIQIPLTKC